MGFGHRVLSIKSKGSVLLPWMGLCLPLQIGSLSQLQPEAGGRLSGAITASSLGGPHLSLGAKGSEVRGAGPADPTSWFCTSSLNCTENVKRCPLPAWGFPDDRKWLPFPQLAL